MTRRLSLALFGLCQTGERELRQLACHPGVSINWIVEKDIARAEKMAHTLPPQFNTNIIKPSYAHLVYEDPKVDAVLVGSLYGGVNWVRRTLNHGKGVLCETPTMCRDTGAVLACHEIAETIDKPLMFFLNSRFDSFTIRARDIILSGKIGQIKSMRIKSSCGLPLSSCDPDLSGDLILSCLLPGLDQVCWLIQEDPVTVHVRQTKPSLHADHHVNALQVDICFPSGVTATIGVNRERVTDSNHLEVCGTEGKILVNAGKSLRKHSYNDSSSSHRNINTTATDNQKTSLMVAILHFIDVIRGDTTSRVPIADVLRLSIVAAACEESLRTDTIVPVSQNLLHKDSLLHMPVWQDRPDVY